MSLSDYFARRTGTGPSEVRQPAVSGRFYSADPDVLRRSISTFMRRARPRPPGVAPARVIVAPHAGYVYSGQVVADAFSQCGGTDIDLVVLLGTSHTRAGAGAMSIYPGAAFRTPLGEVAVDLEARDALMAADPGVRLDAAAHAAEHSIEVHVPFLQVLFPGARIVPVVVGEDRFDACERLGRAVAAVVEPRRALVVASSDLSHYPNASDARWSDAEVLERMVSLDPLALGLRADELVASRVPNLLTAACGLAPVKVAMCAANALGARDARVVSYASSADVAIGDPGRVVGYGAVAFGIGGPASDASVVRTADPQAPERLDDDDKRALLGLARDTIEQFLSSETLPLPREVPARLHALHVGAFVTLRRHGRLRGCIGRVTHDGPLPQLVSTVAYESAFQDPRFGPLVPDELEGLDVEVSVLTAPRAASVEEIEPGRHGVLLKKLGRTAVFLPKVAIEQGWSRDEMLDHLCLKAGLPKRAWTHDTELRTFEAEVFSEGVRG